MSTSRSVMQVDFEGESGTLAQAAEEAAAAIAKVDQTSKGAGVSTNQLAGAAGGVTNMFRGLGGEAGQVIDHLTQVGSAGKDAASMFGSLGMNAGTAVIGIAGIGAAVGGLLLGLGQMAQKFGESMSRMSESTGIPLPGVIALSRSMSDFGIDADGATKALSGLARAQDELGHASSSASPAIAGAAIPLEELQRVAGRAGVNMKVFWESMAGAGSGAAFDAISKLGPGARALSELGVHATDAAGKMRPLVDVLPEVARALANVSDRQHELALATDIVGARAAPKFVEWVNRMRDSGQDLATTLAGTDPAFTKFAADIEAQREASSKSEEALQNFSMQALPLLTAATLASAEAFGALADSAAPVVEVIGLIVGMIGELSDAYESLPGPVRALLGIGATAINPLMGLSLPGRAIGGPVRGGSPYMVGERGPELFVPNTSGQIIANINTARAAGGGGFAADLSGFGGFGGGTSWDPGAYGGAHGAGLAGSGRAGSASSPFGAGLVGSQRSGSPSDPHPMINVVVHAPNFVGSNDDLTRVITRAVVELSRTGVFAAGTVR